jgi:hypothetical protein
MLATLDTSRLTASGDRRHYVTDIYLAVVVSGQKGCEAT